jgi:hypothetical protein
MSIELLKAARDLISDPAHHTTKAFARNGEGRRVTLLGNDPDAVCWCAVGAIQCLARNRYDRREAIKALDDVALDIFGVSIVAVNDDRGHEAVMRVYDRAIEMAAA